MLSFSLSSEASISAGVMKGSSLGYLRAAVPTLSAAISVSLSSQSKVMPSLLLSHQEKLSEINAGRQLLNAILYAISAEALEAVGVQVCVGDENRTGQAHSRWLRAIVSGWPMAPLATPCRLPWHNLTKFRLL